MQNKTQRLATLRKWEQGIDKEVKHLKNHVRSGNADGAQCALFNLYQMLDDFVVLAEEENV